MRFLDWQGDSAGGGRDWSEEAGLDSNRHAEHSRKSEDLRETVERLVEENRSLTAACRTVEAERMWFAEVFDSAPEGCLITTPDGKILEVNRAAAALIGIRADRLKDSSIFDILSPESRTTCRRSLRRLRSGEAVQDWEVLLENRAGNPRCITISLAACPGPAGHPSSLRWTLRDVTAQRRAEAELRIKDSAIASFLNAVLIADLNGVITYANRASLTLWGYDDAGDLLGRRITRLFADEEGIDRMVQALREHGTWSGVLTGRRRQGHDLLIQVAANTITDGLWHPLCIVIYGMDVTDQKRAEYEVLRSENLYRTVFDATGIAMLIAEPDGAVVVANAEFEMLSGYSRAEIRGSYFWNLFFTGEDRVSVRRFFQASRNNLADVPGTIEASLIDHSGAIHTVLITVAELPAMERHVVTMLDISGHQRM